MKNRTFDSAVNDCVQVAGEIQQIPTSFGKSTPGGDFVFRSQRRLRAYASLAQALEAEA